MKPVLSIFIVLSVTGCYFSREIKSRINDEYKTRYPVLLVHGFGFRDDVKVFPYWGRIPEKLRSGGALVYLSGQDACQTCEKNAMIIYAQVSNILMETGAGKVNIIAHSKGGIEARYLITVLDKGSNIASLTTIATPHHGSSFAEFMLTNTEKYNLPSAEIVNFYAKIIGDKNPDVHTSAVELTRASMSNFNSIITDMPGVYYQSYGAVMKNPVHDPFFYFSYRVILSNEGPNDGLVSTNSCVWGDFKGILEGASNSDGLSHTDVHDIGRKNTSGFDTPRFYAEIVTDLKKRGF